MGERETLVVERQRPAHGRPIVPSIRFRELNILLALGVLVAFFS